MMLLHRKISRPTNGGNKNGDNNIAKVIPERVSEGKLNKAEIAQIPAEVKDHHEQYPKTAIGI